MNPVLSTAASGLQAAQARLNSTAHNVANAQTEGFQRQQTTGQALPSGGVQTQTGRVPQPGADLAQDTVERISAAYSFQANLKTVQTADAMLGALLDTRA